VTRVRTVKPVLPRELGRHDGLAYSLWLPECPEPPAGGAVILHGAGSCKESHHDFARLLVSAGLGAISFDQRGHGHSGERLDAGAIDDIASIVDLLRSELVDSAAPVALRGSSMGGYFAILAASQVRARAVVSICPASAEGLRRSLRAGTVRFDADDASLDAFLAEHDLHAAVESLAVPLLILHAEGDEQVPVEHSRELAQRCSSPGSRLIAVPGGHHRSVQHDPELQAVSLRFIQKAFAGRRV
jgi:uncharacterized protein